jgi:hypothetical protein
MTIIAPAMRGFIGARSKPILVFSTIAPVAPSTTGISGVTNSITVPCTVSLTAPAWAEYVSGGSNAGFSTTATVGRGQAAVKGLNITNGMALWGQCDAPTTHSSLVTVTVRVLTAQNGTLLGTYQFSFSTN